MRMVGIDIGGTFTDIVVIDTATGSIQSAKVPTTRPDTSEGVGIGLAGLIGPDAKPSHLVLGTTTGTNAVIERKGVPTALLVSEGFGDILYIGRQQRPSLYDFFAEKVRPLVDGDLVREVGERLVADGSVLKPLAEQEITEILEWLKRRSVGSVAICLLHSYRNAAHERLLAQRIRQAIPGCLVSVSADIAPEPREYERCSTAVVDAYIKPIMLRETNGVEAAAARSGIGRVLVMQSNAGVLPSEAMNDAVVGTLSSGPAGGVRGAIAVMASLGEPDFLTLDMGGTSADIAVVQSYEPGVRYEWEIGGVRGRWAPAQSGLPVRVPALDVFWIGAGGGSLAEVSGQRLRVGPESAGGVPGPACYGKGNTRPTVSDANVALGRLPEAALERHGVRLRRDLAVKAVEEHIAKPLGLPLERAALGIVNVVNANMTFGIRRVSVVRGLDPRGFPLIAFGGAGALHAAELAQELGLSRVVIPPSPGTLSALGLVSTGYRRDFVTTTRVPLGGDTAARILKALHALEADARTAFPEAALPGVRRQRFEWIVEARYRGQGHALAVALARVDDAARLAEAIGAAFEGEHTRRYGYARRGVPVEVTVVRVSHHVDFLEESAVRAFAAPRHARRPETRVFFEGGWQPTPVLDRGDLAPGKSATGPAVIVEDTATTLVPPGCRWTVAGNGCIVIDIGQ